MTYLIEHCQLDSVNYCHILSCIQKYDTKTQAFIKHLIASTVVQRKTHPEGWIPIPFSFIKKEFRGANWQKLEADGLIQVEKHSIWSHRCREYKICAPFINQLTQLTPVEEYLQRKKVNLITGKPTKTHIKSKFTDENRNSHPKLIINAMKSIEYCYINLRAVDWYLLRSQISRKKSYINDLWARNHIIEQGLKKTDIEGIYTYKPAYYVQSTGRIGEVRGGLQSCSRGMKEAAFYNIPNVHNYDLKASQAVMLAVELERARIPHPWLDKYLLEPEFREALPGNVGISRDTWKQCFYALLMGATTRPYRFQDNQLIANSVFSYLGQNKQLIDKFKIVTQPLRTYLKQWYQWIEDIYIRENKSKKGFISNQTGMTIKIKDNDIKQVAAFLLQGREAAFIFELQLVSHDFNFKVMSNQYDGLVTLGTIPKEAIAHAQKLSHLNHPALELVEKSFI